MNKVVFVEAHFVPVGETRVVNVPTGEKKKGVFGQKDVMRKEEKWVQTGVSDVKIDTDRLTKNLQETVEQLNSEGYEVINVSQVISGSYNWAKFLGGGGHGGSGYGYGYSYTDGLMVVARKV